MEMKVGNVLLSLMVTTILFSCLLIGSRAQQLQQQQQCIDELRFCIRYLNDTSQPPHTCCQPLDYIVKSLPQCFCNFMSTLAVDLVKSMGINISRAQTLPERCGQRVNPLECITGTSVARSNNPTPNTANYSILWDSSFVIAFAAFSIIINLREL
ncbi:lipid transfer-like protein vas [Salvia divinorum]|uniref:Lipid transfer-like protein vas n=1 Tax=Salvia divinorum TaxID=28513 RepID=A0ABD1GF39_SALDI